MTMGVYAIRNKINKKVYVGSSVDIEKRFKKHIRELNKNSHHSYKLQDAWKQAGRNENIFQLIILEEVEYKSQLKKKEQEYIYSEKAYQYGYNCSEFAVNPYYTKKYNNVKKNAPTNEIDEDDDKYFKLFCEIYKDAKQLNHIFFNKELISDLENQDENFYNENLNEDTFYFLWDVIDSYFNFYCDENGYSKHSLSVWEDGASLIEGVQNNSEDDGQHNIVLIGYGWDKNNQELIDLFQNNSFSNYYKINGIQ